MYKMNKNYFYKQNNCESPQSVFNQMHYMKAANTVVTPC